MKEIKCKKSEQLGMSVGTASNQLKKIILFDLIKQLNQNYCFQCKKEIDTEKELSIEHKIPYLDSEDPKGLFFDLGNIAFSHLSCNVAAAIPRLVKHPSRKAYQKGCRCYECTKLYQEYSKEWMKQKRSQLVDSIKVNTLL